MNTPVNGAWLRPLLISTLALMPLLEAANAHASEVLLAAHSNDVERLEQIAQSEDADAGLARAMVLSWRHDDRKALAALEQQARGETRPQFRAMVLQELSALHMRNSRFRAAHEALASAKALAPLDAETQQTLGFLEALRDVPPMRCEPGAKGRLSLTRDAAGLARVDSVIDGHKQQVVVDTGASFSTITASTAQRLGLTLLGSQATVGSAGLDAIPTRFAVARELRLAQATLHDVTFIVLPDESLSFDGGKYRIDAILGLPVFLQLGRLAVQTGSNGKEVLSLGPTALSGTGPANMLIKGLQPLLLARSVPEGRTLRMFIDTGARKSQFHRNAADVAPELLEGAQGRAKTLSGAGGSSTDSQALSLPRVALMLGKCRVNLSDVAMLSTSASDRHGAIGQDVLRQSDGYVMDFEHMRLSLLRCP